METLSGAASIIAILQITGTIITACNAYIEGVQTYRKQVRAVRMAIQSLAVIFETLNTMDQNDPDDVAMLAHLGKPDGPIEGCRAVVEALSSLISLPTAISSNGQNGKKQKQKLQVSLATLAWPLKADQARKLMEELNQYKSTIDMAIGGIVLREVHAIKKSLSDAQVREVCDWFQKTDPSTLHNAALCNYEETCDWVTRYQDWKDWLNLGPRCLWIHGIPGAGKTVLLAYLIEQVREECEKRRDKKTTYVYYYCYHGHNQDETDHLLRWVISQLCRQLNAIPELVHEQFRNSRQPTYQNLLMCLGSLLEHFETVFLMIDALDESQSRENLVHSLEQLLSESRFQKLQILATSREYHEIETAMEQIATPISMSNDLVNADISRYIQGYIAREPKFQKWPTTLRDEVQEQLSEGAKGMFRWAVCQLDILKRLRHEHKIREAIKVLPITLDETYERIFSLISTEDRSLVRHTLHWISFRDSIEDDGIILEMRDPFCVLGTYLINEKMHATDVGEPRSFCEETIDDLKECCGCLIRVDLGPLNGKPMQIYIAHYTVYEFLRSNRALTSATLFFQINNPASQKAVCDKIFNIALVSPADRKKLVKECSGTAMDVISCCNRLSWELLYHGDSTDIDGHISLDYVRKFYDPSLPHFPYINKHSNEVFGDDEPMRFSLPRLWDTNWTRFQVPQILGQWFSLAYATASHFVHETHLVDLSEMIIKEFPQCLESSFHLDMSAPSGVKWEFSGDALEYFSHCGGICHLKDKNPLRMLLQNLNRDVDYSRLLCLQVALHYFGRCPARNEQENKDCIINFILSNNAAAHSEHCPVTPLQIAVARRDKAVVKILLDAGADPNMCGTHELKDTDWADCLSCNHLPEDPVASTMDWADNVFLHPFYHLRSSSPLTILRHREPVHSEPVHREEYIISQNEIERLLTQAGARGKLGTLSYTGPPYK